MSTPTGKEQFTFQAEIKQLLHLLSHSLYQSREIAVRELVSNASDALDKMRYLALTDKSVADAGPLEITIERDEDARLLAIVDTGIGMTHDELIASLGRIAHSGSREFLEKLTGDANQDLSLIGQFGVGFYSAFMLADKVVVKTRSYQEDSGWEWESAGTGEFAVSAAEGLPRGTRVELNLKEDAKDFANEHRIKQILKKYSCFVAHPIRVSGEQVNDVKPVWVEPKSQVTEEQYHSLYQHLTHRGDEKPLWHVHVAADSPIQFRAVLFCPPSNPELLGFSRLEHGLTLCAKRVMVQSNCQEVLPEYMRFLYGLVDSEDLPLNISRESLQDNAVFRKIKTALTKRILDRMEELANEDNEQYLQFYGQFGPLVKEGAASDFEHRDRLAKLLRFSSSAAEKPEVQTSLDAYVERCEEAQKQIYYIGGQDLASIERNPNLEIFRQRGLEVLYMTEPIDEFVAATLGEYQDRKLISIDSADVELPAASEEAERTEDDAEETQATSASGFAKVLDLFRTALGDKVQEVRESKRLTDSPCCLINPEGGMSVQMQKLLKLANKDFHISKRILEVNPKAPLIKRLAEIAGNPDNESFIKRCGEQLCDNAVLLEGVATEPQTTVERVQAFMEEAARTRSSIILDS